MFVKRSDAGDADARFAAECRGLQLVGAAGVRTPAPIGPGVVPVPGGALLVLEALAEIHPDERGPAEWRAIGRALAGLHGTTATTFGLAGLDGWFGPLPQDNRPVPGGWAAFLRERRIEPFRRAARAGGHLPIELDRRLDVAVARLTELVGPEPVPRLLHGDAQQHNFVSTANGAALIDVAPYFGHPEVDLAMLGIFRPVPDDVLAAYAEVHPLQDGFTERIELWRLPAYLAVIAVDGAGPFGRAFVGRLATALSGLGA